jgi:hypothetical protein
VILDAGGPAIRPHVAVRAIGLQLAVAIAGLLRGSGTGEAGNDGDAAKAARALVKRFIVTVSHRRFAS